MVPKICREAQGDIPGHGRFSWALPRVLSQTESFSRIWPPNARLGTGRRGPSMQRAGRVSSNFAGLLAMIRLTHGVILELRGRAEQKTRSFADCTPVYTGVCFDFRVFDEKPRNNLTEIIRRTF